MLGGYRPGGLGEVQRDAVIGLDHQECANRVAGGNPRILVRNGAERCWSRHETMVWFSCGLTAMIVPSVLRRERSGPADY